MLCRHFFSCASRTTHLFFFTPTPTTYIYTLSLHDALPILRTATPFEDVAPKILPIKQLFSTLLPAAPIQMTLLAISSRSEEHTSELQSRFDLVCRLLLEKKKNTNLDKLLIKKLTLIHTDVT